MKVIRAEVLGFCAGVRRAVETARNLSSGKELRIFTLGPLIHNREVLESLKARGVACINENEISSLPQNSTVIIRAHGVSPALERELLKKGMRVVDATCPRVKQSQRRAEDFAGKGYRVFLAGEENHAEVEGIRGYAEDGFERASGGAAAAVPSAGDASAACPAGACFVVSSPDAAGEAAEALYRRESGAKTALIGQTTIRAAEYRAVRERIARFFPQLETVDSICEATAQRQAALRKLAAEVDALIIAGSRESANTQRLLSLARELGKPAWLAETPADIPPGIAAYRSVGISAGASAPDSLVAEIEKALSAF